MKNAFLKMAASLCAGSFALLVGLVLRPDGTPLAHEPRFPLGVADFLGTAPADAIDEAALAAHEVGDAGHSFPLGDGLAAVAFRLVPILRRIGC